MLRSLDHVAPQSCPTARMWTCRQCKSTRWAGDGRGHQGTSGDGRGHQGMAGDIRGWQAAPLSWEPEASAEPRHRQLGAVGHWGGQTCGSLFGSQLRMLDAPLGASELLPDPASLWAEFWLVWSSPSRPRRAPSSAFPARGRMVALHSHGLVLSALYEDLDLKNKTLYFLLKEQGDGLPRRELSWLCNLLLPATSLKTSCLLGSCSLPPC